MEGGDKRGKLEEVRALRAMLERAEERVQEERKRLLREEARHRAHEAVEKRRREEQEKSRRRLGPERRIHQQFVRGEATDGAEQGAVVTGKWGATWMSTVTLQEMQKKLEEKHRAREEAKARKKQAREERRRQTQEKKQTREAKRKERCLFYSSTGKCANGNKCRFVHDRSKRAICRNFLRGMCPLLEKDCLLSHTPDAHRLPHCMHFLRGSCDKVDCMYPHVRVAKDAPQCRMFKKFGYCRKGRRCKDKHQFGGGVGGGQQAQQPSLVEAGRPSSRAWKPGRGAAQVLEGAGERGRGKNGGKEMEMDREGQGQGQGQGQEEDGEPPLKRRKKLAMVMGRLSSGGADHSEEKRQREAPEEEDEEDEEEIDRVGGGGDGAHGLMGIRPVFFLPDAGGGGSSPEDNNEKFSSWPGVDWEDDGEEKMVDRGAIFPPPSPSTTAS